MTMQVTFGPTVIVTDPCYERGTHCASSVDVVAGDYVVEVDYQNFGSAGFRDDRVVRLRAIKQGAQIARWQTHPTHLGVDSGQLGFFDDTIYPHDKSQFDYDPGTSPTFYTQCCKHTLGEYESGAKHGLIGGKGVVSSSGFGDGSYELVQALDHDERVVGLCVVFIQDDEDEDYDHYDDGHDD